LNNTAAVEPGDDVARTRRSRRARASARQHSSTCPGRRSAQRSMSCVHG